MKYSLLLLALLMGMAGCKDDPKPGEIWKYESDGEIKQDPLRECENIQIDTHTVCYDSILSVENGLVWYLKAWSGNEWGDKVYCSKINYFEIQENKIK